MLELLTSPGALMAWSVISTAGIIGLDIMFPIVLAWLLTRPFR